MTGINVIKIAIKLSFVSFFNFQEAIKENSVTMNKMRLLKNKMESQKNIKVYAIRISQELVFFI